jgi:hypothetical protein
MLRRWPDPLSLPGWRRQALAEIRATDERDRKRSVAHSMREQNALANGRRNGPIDELSAQLSVQLPMQQPAHGGRAWHIMDSSNQNTRPVQRDVHQAATYRGAGQ